MRRTSTNGAYLAIRRIGETKSVSNRNRTDHNPTSWIASVRGRGPRSCRMVNQISASTGAISSTSVAARTGENRPRRSCQRAISAPQAVPDSFSGCDHGDANLASQNAAGCLSDRAHDLLRNRLNFSFGQGALPRLNRNRDRERLLALRYSPSLIDIKQLHRLDQLAVDTARGLDHLINGDIGVDDECEIPGQRHQIGGFEFRPRLAAARFGGGDRIQKDLKQGNRAFEIEGGRDTRMQLAKPRQRFRTGCDRS